MDRRLLRCGLAVALVALVVGVIANAEAAPTAHSASLVSTVKKYARQYAKQYAKRGPRGFQGERGPQGEQGPAGIAHITEVESQHYTLQPGQTSVDAAGIGNMKANCPAGSYVVGTGFDGGIGETYDTLSYHYFAAAFFKNNKSISYEVYVQAICASGPGLNAKAQAKVSAASAQAAYVADNKRDQRLHAGR